MTHNKAYLVPYDDLLAANDDTVERPRMLTDFECSILLSQLEYLQWEKRYINTNTPLSDRQAKASLINEKLMSSGTIDMTCTDVVNCVADSEIETQIKQINRQLATTLNAFNTYQFNTVYGGNIAKKIPNLPATMLPPSYTTTQQNIMCDTLNIWLSAWYLKALESINAALNIVDFTQTLTNGLPPIAAAFVYPVQNFLLFGYNTFADMNMIDSQAELLALKSAYEDTDAKQEILCALIEVFAYRTVGFSSYINAMNILPSKVSLPAASLVVAHMIEKIADANLPEYFQPAYLYMVELFSVTNTAAAPNGGCVLCDIPALCSGANGEIDMPVNVSSLPPPPPAYVGSSVSLLQAPIGVWHYRLTTGENYWLEYRRSDDICIRGVNGIYRAQSANIINGKMKIYVDDMLVHVFTMPTPLGQSPTAFTINFADIVIGRNVRFMVEHSTSTDGLLMRDNGILWKA